tara:strand:+ start:203 stop:328 length:126 start_codon:yes stop_codon:yes gene_type:complete
MRSRNYHINVVETPVDSTEKVGETSAAGGISGKGKKKHKKK